MSELEVGDDDAATVTQPVRRLVGFQRVALRPGETRTVRFVVPPESMAFHDLELRQVVEPGRFTLSAGGSSEATLSAAFTAEGEVRVLAPAPPRAR